VLVFRARAFAVLDELRSSTHARGHASRQAGSTRGTARGLRPRAEGERRKVETAHAVAWPKRRSAF
jgi:hypothetical protein